MNEEELKEYLMTLCSRNDIYIEEVLPRSRKEEEDKKWISFESTILELISDNKRIKEIDSLLNKCGFANEQQLFLDYLAIKLGDDNLWKQEHIK